ncbi:MAG: flagellar basal body rod protein FlgB [Clostridia bacterium]|nr:flagellar basal body rod protein FlgB [Clostridia bacterium]
MKFGIFRNPTMDILKKSLAASSLRHQVISNNIANINTPHYKRQLVVFEEELNKALQKNENISLNRTHSLHLPIKHLDFSPQTIVDDKSTMRTDGNNVDIDLELAMLAENTVRFNVLSQAINKKFSILRNVIQGGR